MNRRQSNAGWESHKTHKRYMMKCSKKTHVERKSAKLCAGKPTFFSSKPMPTPATSIAQSGFTISLPALALACSKKMRSEEHTSELQSQSNIVCRLLLEKKQI